MFAEAPKPKAKAAAPKPAAKAAAKKAESSDESEEGTLSIALLGQEVSLDCC